jgi:hypothetical protein
MRHVTDLLVAHASITWAPSICVVPRLLHPATHCGLRRGRAPCFRGAGRMLLRCALQRRCMLYAHARAVTAVGRNLTATRQMPTPEQLKAAHQRTHWGTQDHKVQPCHASWCQHALPL